MGVRPPASATSATLPAPTSITKDSGGRGRRPQRPPLAPHSRQPVPGEPETKMAFFLVLLEAGSRALPSALGSRPPCLQDAGVAKAPATPAGTGTDGRWWPQTRGARGLAPGPGPALPAAGPGPGRRPPCALPCCGAAPCPPAPVSLPPLQSSALETSRGLCHLVPVTFASL